MDRWRELFDAAVAARGQAEVARDLGYSKATICRVAGDKYTGDLKKLARRVIEVYGTREDIRMQVPEGYMKDRQGRLVREEDVQPVERLKDDLTRKMFCDATKVAVLMANWKKGWLEDMQSFLQVAAEQYGVKKLEGKNGDFAILSFDGAVKIERVHRKLMVVDEAAAIIAKEMVDRVVDKLSADLPGDVKKAVRAAFRRDERGNYSATALLALARRLKLPDNPEWQQAVAAISDAVTVEYGDPYVRFYALDKDGKSYRQIPLDFPSVVVKEVEHAGD